LISEEQAAKSFAAWPPHWRGQVLSAPPMIAPARQFTYPRQISGEEDALARGALQVMVHPVCGGTFLATCALGFTSLSTPTGVFACPNPDELCAVAGGYAYIIDTTQPERSTHLGIRPVVEVRVLPEQGLLLFVGFHQIAAWSPNGLAWQTDRLSWEGLRLGDVEDGRLYGFGWNLPTDQEIAFSVDLKTGTHTGGGF